MWAVGLHSPTVHEWFGAAESQPSGAGFLFVVLGSLAVGLVLSGFRQIVLDGGWRLLALRIPVFRPAVRPKLNEVNLRERDVREAIAFSADSYYRYYQFYGNMIFALLGLFFASRWGGQPSALGDSTNLYWILPTVAVLGLSAYYSLSRYYASLTAILGVHGRRVDEQRMEEQTS